MKKRMLALAVMSTIFSVGFVLNADAAENAGNNFINIILMKLL